MDSLYQPYYIIISYKHISYGSEGAQVTGTHCNGWISSWPARPHQHQKEQLIEVSMLEVPTTQDEASNLIHIVYTLMGGIMVFAKKVFWGLLGPIIAHFRSTWYNKYTIQASFWTL